MPGCRPGVVVALALLAPLTAALFMNLVIFDGTAGDQGQPPLRWPASSLIRREVGKCNLLVFAHPFCACTRATLDEIAQALALRRGTGPATSVRILFVRPSHSNWKADAWSQANSIPAVVAWDEDGLEARLFNAKTSGVVLLYSSDGRLLFQGGVTGSRGHRGDNYGLQHLATALSTGTPSPTHNLVFGCSLALQSVHGEQGL